MKDKTGNNSPAEWSSPENGRCSNVKPILNHYYKYCITKVYNNV